MTNHPHRATPAAPTGAAPPSAAVTPFARLVREDSGQDLVEYALIAACMGLASVAGIHGIAAQIANDMNIVLHGFKHATGS